MIFIKKTKKVEREKEVITTQEEAEPEEFNKENNLTLLEVLQLISPIGFEHVCKRLFREHGFENVVFTQASHDNEIDSYGTLKLNPSVSIKVLFQLKRYKGNVARV